MCCSICSHGQLWIDKQFTYDSVLNITYGTAIDFNGDTDTLLMDVFIPKCTTAGTSATYKPLLLWIHGGAFLAGDKNDPSIQNHCKQFAKRGYVTATISYRLGFCSDDALWQCNYPNYSCVFASDSAEWVRSYYRAVQDAKGALRYLVNRFEQYGIDTSNIFVAGESAGAFTALGVALLDTASERPPHTYALPNAPKPHIGTATCTYNLNKTFSNSGIARPDLGDIEGTIEPTTINYTIRGIGNMYGAMLGDLLKHKPANKVKPAIYSFHQPCDIVVPIDSNYIYWGLTWCFTNGYNCYGIANTNIMLYGGRTFSQWNANNNYGYTIQNKFTNVNFPYNYLIGAGSCVDQVNTPCHAYDNPQQRESELALFFKDYISSNPPCLNTGIGAQIQTSDSKLNEIYITSNTAGGFSLHNKQDAEYTLTLFDAYGHVLYKSADFERSSNLAHIQTGGGICFARISNRQNQHLVQKVR
jgi:hypothetical protein